MQSLPVNVPQSGIPAHRPPGQAEFRRLDTWIMALAFTILAYLGSGALLAVLALPDPAALLIAFLGPMVTALWAAHKVRNENRRLAAALLLSSSLTFVLDILSGIGAAVQWLLSPTSLGF